jgi:hypothetical protein
MSGKTGSRLETSPTPHASRSRPSGDDSVRGGYFGSDLQEKGSPSAKGIKAFRLVGVIFWSEPRVRQQQLRLQRHLHLGPGRTESCDFVQGERTRAMRSLSLYRAGNYERLATSRFLIRVMNTSGA